MEGVWGLEGDGGDGRGMRRLRLGGGVLLLRWRVEVRDGTGGMNFFLVVFDVADCQITRILSLRWVGKTSRAMILQCLDHFGWIREGRCRRLLLLGRELRDGTGGLNFFPRWPVVKLCES